MTIIIIIADNTWEECSALVWEEREGLLPVAAAEREREGLLPVAAAERELEWEEMPPTASARELRLPAGAEGVCEELPPAASRREELHPPEYL